MAAPSPRVLITAAFILSVLLTTALLYSGTSFTFPNLSHPSTFIKHPSDTINRHLSASECMTRFPELYLEADRAKKWYRAKGGIRKEDVDDAERDDGQARLVILDNKVCSSSGEAKR